MDEMGYYYPADFLNREQLHTRALRGFLNRAGRRDLEAVPESFREIAHMKMFNYASLDIRVIPECINLLTGCTFFGLLSCRLDRDDSFPDTFWQLTGLENLILRDCALTYIPSGISSGIGQLSSLTVLGLSVNNLVSLPDEIYQLPNLKVLFLNDNKLESISEEIGKLTNLTKLDVQNNRLKSLPKSIGKLINFVEPNDYVLEYGLWIQDNPLTSLPDSIRKVKHALNNYSVKQYELLLEDVEYRVEQRVQRRLVILLAKPAPPSDEDDEEAVEKHYNQAIYQVLQDSILRIKIAKYISYDSCADNNNNNNNNKCILS